MLAALDQRHETDGLKRFSDQARAMALDSLSADPFLAAMMARTSLNFTGTSAELLQEMNWGRTELRDPHGWPKTARHVTGILKRNAPALRGAGWTVEADEDLHTKVISWQLIHPEIAREGDTQHPQPPQCALRDSQRWR